MEQNSRISVQMRGMLVSEIYDKPLLIDLESPSDFSTATLMTADVQRWSSIAQVALSVWLLERQVGLVCLVPIGASICKKVSNQN